VFPAEHHKQLADGGLAGLERDVVVDGISVPSTDPSLGDITVSFKTVDYLLDGSLGHANVVADLPGRFFRVICN
jgi:hypothetical protein